MKKLLLTAFEPFGGEDINSSLMTLKLIPDQIGDWQIIKHQVPVVFGEAGKNVLAKADEVKPDAIISMGQAEGQADITPELVGINLRNARIADNSGAQPLRVAVDPEGPAAYFSTLPVFEMVDAINNEGIPASVSYSAGTFVCNDLLYTLLRHYDGSEVGAVFIHLPLTPEQAKGEQPSLKVEDMARGIIKAIETI